MSLLPPILALTAYTNFGCQRPKATPLFPTKECGDKEPTPPIAHSAP
jgi:hypothetical protein